MFALYNQTITYINSIKQKSYSGPKDYLDIFRYTECMSFIVL